MIKAEDLRIGDLVRVSCNCALAEGTIGTIVEISKETNANDKKGFVKLIPINGVSNWGWGVSCDNIEGISLTCNNLSNNNWGASQIGEHEFLIYNEDEDIYLEWSDIGDRYTFNDFLHSKIFKTVRYIHELQHILWAFGRNANFKI